MYTVVMSLSIKYQRLEAAAVLAGSVLLYAHQGYSWLWFALLLFLVDILMIGYAVNNAIGAYTYNLGHSYIVPAILLTWGVTIGNDICLMFGLIWLAHIGLDRMLGYGMKEINSFHDTHLGKIGK